MKINNILKILCVITTTIFLTGFKDPSPNTTTSTTPHKGVWSIPVGVGLNWKPKAEAAKENNPSIGFVGTIGIKWAKPFCKRWTFAPGLLWALFLPDMFMANNPTTWHGSIFGIKIAIPYNLALFIPMTSLQLGYWLNSQWHFSCGLIYLCGLQCNVHYLISPRISLNGQGCLFLDKLLDKGGIHLGFATIGIDYKLFV